MDVARTRSALLRSARRWGIAAAAMGAAVGLLAPAPRTAPAGLSLTGSGFLVGAADSDVTPPALDTALGQRLDAAAFVPVCGTSETQIETLWPGKRLFAFEEPYRDLFGTGQYVPGDPYCDADAAHRYQAPYLAGGEGANRWPLTSADAATNSPATRLAASQAPRPGDLQSGAVPDDPIGAHVAVFVAGGRRVAVVSVDSIGIFDSTFDRIRSEVHEADPALAPADIFFSSTHDESAPDPIGLWGPDLSQDPSPVNQLNGQLPASITSGVDEYYMSYMARQVAGAVVRADHAAEPASLSLVTARMPADTQSCWSSYPFIDTQLMPVMQARATSPADAGKVIFTLVNVGTHDESLAFSRQTTLPQMLSGDWTGRLSARLESAYPGSVGMEVAGLVGSVETPALYPEGTTVTDVPGALHNVGPNPVDRCRSVYPEPAGVQPESDALAFVDEYAQSVADTTEAALGSPGVTTAVPSTVDGQARSVCVQLENNLFLAAFAAGLFPDRPAYADPACTVGLSLSGSPAVGLGVQPATPRLGAPAFLRTAVGVVTVGPAQIAFSPGEVFPVTEVGGPEDGTQMPFPTTCFEPSLSSPSNGRAGNYTCGSSLPMTPDIGAAMTEPFRFLAGLGQDMVGYLFPPGNFVGSQGQTLEQPWALYEETANTGSDRFGYGHSDDSESVGQYAGLATGDALLTLLGADGTGTTVLPGMFVDAAGRLCDSPFPVDAVTSGDAAGSWVAGCGSFSGAVGVEVVEPGGARRVLDVGATPGVSGWATYLATPDTGTAGTAYPYSVATRGVIVDGTPLLVDVYSGAAALGA